ncbi:MAG: TonB-dependent receptor [Prevotella sp.]|nr:TonB-dependent receptor [Prevotella sp.]MBO7539355.1 TonB-dependent receptor [Prevotella sp.]
MRLLLTSIVTMLSLSAFGQDIDSLQADTMMTQSLDNVTITSRRSGTRRMGGAVNGVLINREELFKAACCNLGESFTTNPSVDVNYSDAATGAKQIKLLGLSGTYVQMLTENLPNFRGAAAPYSLDYVPGPWMNSIQVSKGSSSVRNGYESITGQIDIEYLKPDNDEGVTVNLYGGTLGRLEANADANVHLDDKLSTEVLVHYQDDFGHHDVNNDGFLDQPNVRQWNLQNRWKWKGDHYLFHGGFGMVKEKREGGQTEHSSHLSPHTSHLYKIGVETERYEGYMKHAFILDPEHGTNIAVMGNASMHLLDANYGNKHYSVNQKNAYAQLLFETNFTEQHNLSTGLSLNYDYLTKEDKETTPGAYVQYTYNLNDKVVAMAGIRADHSSRYGTFVTPRFHLKLTPSEIVSLRLSAGKGYRTVHALAENNNLLASGRQLVIDDLEQERAWNYGISSSFYIPLFGKTLKLNAEYYHTNFSQQAVIDYDSNPSLIRITNLNGKSYSNTIQIDATYPVVQGLELTAAWRWNDVKCTYGGELMEKPLTSRYKGLVTASYKTPLGLWQVDATLQLNGGGRMPTPVNGLWDEHFQAYEQVSAQITRWFRHFSVYIGGENLTAFRQKKTIINAEDPWSATFDPTMVWGPVHGAMFYAGIRVNFGRL